MSTKTLGQINRAAFYGDENAADLHASVFARNWERAASAVAASASRADGAGVTAGEERVAWKHAVDLEQCSLFVESPPLKKSMTEAATFLRSLLATHPAGQSAGSGAEEPDVVRDGLDVLVTEMRAWPGTGGDGRPDPTTAGYVGDLLHRAANVITRFVDAQKLAPVSTRTGDEGSERLVRLLGAVSERLRDNPPNGLVEGDLYVAAKNEGPDSGWRYVPTGLTVSDLDEARAALAARPADPEAQGAEISQAAADVLAERRRQVEIEGWAPEHDDAHVGGEIAAAAGTYALVASGRFLDVAKRFWPWDFQWWKPCDARRNLVKSAALAIAEIERIDRAAPPASSGQED